MPIFERNYDLIILLSVRA